MYSNFLKFKTNQEVCHQNYVKRSMLKLLIDNIVRKNNGT